LTEVVASYLTFVSFIKVFAQVREVSHQGVCPIWKQRQWT